MARDPFEGCNPAILRDDCTLDTCCLAQSPFNYIPDFGGNLFFTILFAVFIVPSAYLGWRYKTVGFGIAMVSGLILEVVGYAARVWLSEAPFEYNPFLIYLICLTIAPVFFTAAIYLCLTRIIVIFSPSASRLAPRTVACTFMTLDFLALVLQAIGGGITDTASTPSTRQAGINTMIAGLILQCLSIAAFMAFCGDFFLRIHRHKLLDPDPVKVSLRQRSLFKAFLVSLALATIAILIRSLYRAAELWEGFDGELWHHEVEFMVLDGAMISLAVLCVTLLQPGVAFRGQWKAGDWTFKTRQAPGGVVGVVHGSREGSSGDTSTAEGVEEKGKWKRFVPGKKV